MNEYAPDRWVVVKIVGGEIPLTYKVFASWHGGYMDSGGSWKLNSGVEKVTKLKMHYKFKGFSGSIYKCHKNAYGMTNYGAMVLLNIIRKSKDVEVQVDILPHDTDWSNLIYEQHTEKTNNEQITNSTTASHHGTHLR